MEIEKRIRKLIGEQLSSVTFVQDYLQLHFDGPQFTFYIWPEVWINKGRYLIEDIQYRNMLCELIGKNIKEISYKDELYLIIYFENKHNYLYINLDPNNDDIIYEIAIFSDDEDNTLIIFD